MAKKKKPTKHELELHNLRKRSLIISGLFVLLILLIGSFYQGRLDACRDALYDEDFEDARELHFSECVQSLDSIGSQQVWQCCNEAGYSKLECYERLK